MKPQLSVQTKNIVEDERPEAGYRMMRAAGFSCADFSLNQYLLNLDIYKEQLNAFFSQSMEQLEAFFEPQRAAAEAAGVQIFQMHMPYPIYVPRASKTVNRYLWDEVAPKSLRIAQFLGCRYVVVHGFKLRHYLGSEAAEWARTEAFLDAMAPLAKECGVTMCIENIYDGLAHHIVEGPCCDARLAAERIDRMNETYGAEVLGFCFDSGHANLVGIDFEAFIRTLGPRLKVLHLHDNDGVSDLHQIPYTFAKTRENESSTDWGGLIRGLRAIQFTGALNFETAPVLTAFPDALKQDALGIIAKIGDYWAEAIAHGWDIDKQEKP